MFRALPVTRTSGSVGLPQAFDRNSRVSHELMEKPVGKVREKVPRGWVPLRPRTGSAGPYAAQEMQGFGGREAGMPPVGARGDASIMT
ncbi:hypothetical protein GCM10010383_46430 [Streptomyces lomondensis]|uniref:Uncharacterized protein n=1 Tax=Streptomyces lomondensis TaxID=68229 RepID=A0ABQ2XD51_9ACTN|nr:hypothetical protein GCM10010383_46430 [Streptomyces lomondensis]